MARSLLLRNLIRAQPPAISGQLRRNFGVRPVSEMDVEMEGDPEVLAMRLIEEAIHAVVARRSAPVWLPFVPGASYWVPPRRRLTGARFVGLLRAPLTEEEAMSFTSFRGWPSSAYFLEGIYQQKMESSPKKKSHGEDS